VRRILYIQYTNPAAYPPLQHSSRILADDGWQVLFLGCRAYSANELQFPLHPNIRVRLMPYCPAGWRQKLHYLRYALWVLYWTVRWRPRWIYASDPLICPIARLLSYLPGTRVIYHEHDSPTANQGSRFLRLCLRARVRLAQRTAACILPNANRLERFANEVGSARNLFCVWNCPSRSEVRPSRNGHHSRGLRLVYHGSIVPDRLPLTVLLAMAKLPETLTLRIIGYETVGHPGYVARLLNEAKRLNMEHRVEILGPVPRYELFEISEGDVGLALMPTENSDSNFQHMVGASNKAFDYMACGLALLVSDMPEWVDFCVTPGYALACDPGDPDAITGALRWFADHPVETAAIGDRGRSQIVECWNYELIFQSVANVIEERPRSFL
jgi:glycosyltransferase involved in cell wall biosynthesis